MFNGCCVIRSFGNAPFTAALGHLINRCHRLPSNTKEPRIRTVLETSMSGNNIHRLEHKIEHIERSETQYNENAFKAHEIWIELELLSAKAHALKESDTAYSLFRYLLKKGYYPPSLDSWILFAHHLLPFSDVESTTVLQYPGYRRNPGSGSAQVGSVPTADLSKCILRGGRGFSLSRQTLLLTGGVVPLMNRKPSADGTLLSLFLSDFCDYLTLERKNCGCYRMPFSAETKEKYSKNTDLRAKNLIAAAHSMLNLATSFMKKNEQTVKFSSVAAPIIRLIRFFWEMSQLRVLNTGSLNKESSSSVRREIRQQFSSLFHTLLSVNEEGLGPVSALYFFSSALSLEDWIGSSEVWSKNNEDEASLIKNALLFFVKIQLEALVDVLQALKIDQDEIKVDFLWMARRIDDLVSKFLQHNTNHRNIFQIPSAVERYILLLVAEVLLSAMRREALFPDQFLRDAIEIIERCSPSMFMEAVLLSAKVQLLEVLDLDKEKRIAVYKDLITSLRNLVDLRPRQRAIGTTSYDEGEDSETDVLNAERKDHISSKMDEYSQKVLQRAHEEVITVLCASNELENLNEAYSIIISHKYHGLIVTKEVIKPLLRAFARRGDGRAFNLVDLCVLYSNQTVDMDVFSCLFRVCAVNGDHHRAKTMLKLLEETIPGFLIKAPANITQDLQALKVLAYEPAHLFMTKEDIQISEAMGRKLDVIRPLPQ